MLGTLRVLLTSAHAAPAPRPLCLSLCHLSLPPTSHSRRCPGPVAPVHSWGGRGRGQCCPTRASGSCCHGCPATQQLPLGAGPALGPLWLRVTCWGCSAVRAGTWLGTEGGSISGDTEPGDTAPGCPHQTRPYQEMLGDDGDADSAAGRPLQQRGWR